MTDTQSSACPLVLACDEGYAMPLATTLRSIVEANRSAWPLEIHVLTNNFSEHIRKQVYESMPSRAASIRWIDVNLDAFRGFGRLDYISPMTFARFLIPRVFPEEVSRILYLDADILVLDDLSRLCRTDLEGAVVGAVVDCLDGQFSNGDPKFANVPRVSSYFNAGVLLIDLPQWRKERISETALEYLAARPDTPFADQDALNVACDGRWKRLDSRWNFQEHYMTRLASMPPAARPAIIHFVTSSKPWKASSLSVNASFYDDFRSRTYFARDFREVMWDLLQAAWYRARRELRRARANLRRVPPVLASLKAPGGGA